MIRGVKTSANGMQVQKQMQEVLADNMANANTSGYKAYKHVHKVKAEREIYNNVTGTELGKVSYGSEEFGMTFDFSQGPLRNTGNPLDFALSGKGFFAIQSHDGDVAYSRNGHFTINNDGFLTTAQGDMVLDRGLTPIFVGIQGVNSITVLRDGTFMVNGEYNTAIQAFDFPEGASIVKAGGDKFKPSSYNANMTLVKKTTVEQGFLENSNVSSVKSSAEMVQIMRNYEANQKAMRAQMQTLDYLMTVADQI